MTENKKPEIRFKGFIDDWEQRKVSDEVTSIDTGKSKFDAKESGDYEILGSTEVIGYDDSFDYEGDFLLTARVGANAGTLYRHSGKVKITDNTVFLQGSHIDFAFYLLDKFDLRKMSFGSGQPLIKASELKSLELMMPVKNEEKEKIATYFLKLDHLITLHQRKYDKLKILKKSMLEKMFPKNDSKVPEIRFIGFTDDWEQRKLAELVTRYEDPVETPHDGYIRLGIRSHAKGTFHEYVEPGHELETAQMHRVAANKLIFNITFAWEHAVAITTEDDAGKLVSHRFPQFSLSELLRPEFLKYVILDEGFHHKLYLASPGGAGRNRVLKVDEALDYPIFFPSVEEQHKIGEFLNQLNDLITLHQREKINRSFWLESLFQECAYRCTIE